jgi:CheY-like chemotaxis protein
MARVLVVDDSEELQELLELVLRDAGFETVAALHGERGLELVKTERPDVVLLDMMMPEMDGLEFLSRLHAEIPSPPPVVAYSGYDDFRAEALRRGAVAFLSKPLAATSLVNVLRGVLAERAVPPKLLCDYAAELNGVRMAHQATVRSALSVLDEERLALVRPRLQRIVRWLRMYFGFGTAIAEIVRENEVCLEAWFGGPTPPGVNLYDGKRTPHDLLFCSDVVVAGSTLILDDARRHPVARFTEHPAVKRGWNSYLGTPLTMAGGATVGALCLADVEAHAFENEDMRVLEALARGTARGLEGGPWPLDMEARFRREYFELFVDTVAIRAVRPGGVGSAAIVDSSHDSFEATHLAAVRVDDERVAVLWCGAAHDAGYAATSRRVASRATSQVEVRGVSDLERARAQLASIIA